MEWYRPPNWVFKLNFDGASKGNLGPTGYGGVIQDDIGFIRHIFVGIQGHDSNNAIELWALIQGLKIVIRECFFRLIEEGDIGDTHQALTWIDVTQNLSQLEDPKLFLSLTFHTCAQSCPNTISCS